MLNRFLTFPLIAAKKHHLVPLYRGYLTGDGFADGPGRPGDQHSLRLPFGIVEAFDQGLPAGVLVDFIEDNHAALTPGATDPS